MLFAFEVLPLAGGSPGIHGIVELLACLGAADDVHHIFATLEKHKRPFEHDLLSATVREFNGDFDTAKSLYERAMNAVPEDVYAMLLLGQFHVNRGNLDQALRVFEKAQAQAPESLQIMLELVDIYSAMKHHRKMADTYERAFDLYPQLLEDKQQAKLYHKACKKSGKKSLTPDNLKSPYRAR